MATISILANTVRPSSDRKSGDTAFGAGTFSWQDPVHSWKAGPGEVMNVENLFIYLDAIEYVLPVAWPAHDERTSNHANQAFPLFP